MERLNIKTTDCLLISGKIIEDLSEKTGRSKRILYKAEVSVIPLSEEESKSDTTIRRLLVNRPTITGAVFISTDPQKSKEKLFSVQEKNGEPHLISVFSGVI